jgi:23S rRNA (uracil1939-C5)-methyltransferase
LQLTIEKLVYGGDGLARLPADDQGRGKAVFVPFVLEGEIVDISLIEQKPGFARGSADQILEPSPQRIEPKCPYFMRCGGCHYQHSDYQYQLEIKAAILRENLRRIAKLELNIELKTHPSPEWKYRNRSRFTVRFEPEFGLCYHKFNSHQLLAIEECPISSPLINRVIQALWDMGRADEFPKGVQEIELFADANDAACLIEAYCGEEISTTASEKWAHDCQSRLPAIVGVVVFKNRGSNDSGARKEEVILAGKREIEYQTSKGSYRVSAGSFFQVNREFQRVIAVESSPTSYSDLLYNSAPNMKAVHATAEQYLESAKGKFQPDLVVVDPPRAGLSAAVVKSLVALNAPRITYVSCDPATIARDLRGLLGSGYQLRQAHLIDLFPQTFHIESVFHLVR